MERTDFKLHDFKRKGNAIKLQFYKVAIIFKWLQSLVANDA